MGNSVIDAVIDLRSKCTDVKSPEEFILATAHRQENVDDPKVLEGFTKVFEEAPLPVVLPLHPRTRDKLETFDLFKRIEDSKNVILKGPMDYITFLSYMNKCKLILTDSGGLQEEATVFGKPTVVMRKTSDRPETVEEGFATITGTKPKDILRGIGKM